MNKNNINYIKSEGNKFNVITINKNTDKWSHWSEGLEMFIEKDGISLKLNSEEIQQLVKTLPRTFGGSY